MKIDSSATFEMSAGSWIIAVIGFQFTDKVTYYKKGCHMVFKRTDINVAAADSRLICPVLKRGGFLFLPFIVSLSSHTF